MNEPKVVHEWSDGDGTHCADVNGRCFDKDNPSMGRLFPEGKELARLAARVKDLEATLPTAEDVYGILTRGDPEAENQRLRKALKLIASIQLDLNEPGQAVFWAKEALRESGDE